eukprot:UN18455
MTLRCALTKVEVSVKDDLAAKVVMASSQDAADKKVKDIVQYTIRFDQKAETGDGEYSNFPFDTVTGVLRMELSHFNICGVNYRMDVYRQVNEISWKEGGRCASPLRTRL